MNIIQATDTVLAALQLMMDAPYAVKDNYRNAAREVKDTMSSGQLQIVAPMRPTESNETLVKRIADLERKLSNALAHLDNAQEGNQKLMQATGEQDRCLSKAHKQNHSLMAQNKELERKLSIAHEQLDNAMEENQNLYKTKAELEGDVRRLAGDRNTGLMRLHGSLAEYVDEADEGRNVVYRMNGKLRTMAVSSWCNAAARVISVTEAAQMLVEHIDAANKVIYTNMPTSDKSDTEVLHEVIGHLDNADIVLLMNALRAKDGEK